MITKLFSTECVQNMVLLLFWSSLFFGCQGDPEKAATDTQAIEWESIQKEYRNSEMRLVTGAAMDNSDVLYIPRYFVQTQNNNLDLNLSGDSLVQVLVIGDILSEAMRMDRYL